MFDDIDKIQFLLYAAGALIAYLLARHIRPKTWIRTLNNNRQLVQIAYMGYEKANEAPEMHLTQDASAPMARIMNEGDKDQPEVWLREGAPDDDAHNDYRLRGFIDGNGIIYKQTTRKQAPKAIGYTARITDPNTPTVRGIRLWSSLWLDSELEAFSGAPDPNDTDPLKRRIATARLSGVCIRNKHCISTEAKACAAGMLYKLYGPKEEYHSVYKEPAYGWNDTALLSSIVYAFLFLILYFVYTCVLNHSLLGDDIQGAMILSACYFGLWAVIRQIKITCIENGNSIQPQLDLLNKSVGLSKLDHLITALSALYAYFAVKLNNYDFFPLIAAIACGVNKNKLNKATQKPWTIINNYDEENDNEWEYDNEEKDSSLLVTPSGNLSKTYNWQLDIRYGKELHGSLTVHFDIGEINIEREENPFFLQHKGKSKRDCIEAMIKKLLNNDKMLERTQYIANYINNESKIAHLDEIEKLQFAIDFVQEPNIAFIQSKDSKSIQYAVDYVRYPDETIYDQEGDSNCKALLAAMLLHCMNYNVLFISSEKYQHAAIGIEINANSWTGRYYTDKTIDKKNILDYNHRLYIYCETTIDGFQIGSMIPDMRLDDFETKVELLTNSENGEDIETFEA